MEIGVAAWSPDGSWKSTVQSGLVCTVCGKICQALSVLRIHMRTHTGDRPFTCQVCLKGFKRNSQLKIHIRTHTGEKPYSCTICSKSFNDKSNLNSHMIHQHKFR